MSSTSYKTTGAYLDTGLGICRIHGQIVYTVTRSDNTLSWTNTYSQIKYVRESGSWSSFTYGSGWTQKLYLSTSSTLRETEVDSGTRAVNATDKSGTVSFSSTVSSGTTSVTGKVGAFFSGDSQTNTTAWTITVPTLGSPTLSTQSATNIGQKTATITATASAGSNSSGIASIKLQYGLTTSYGTDSTDSSSPFTWNLTGLSPGKTYHYRFVITNNGGKATTTVVDYTFDTLPVAGMLPILTGLLNG